MTEEWAKFCETEDGGIYALSTDGIVQYTPPTGDERLISKQYDLDAGTFRASVTIKGVKYDILNLLRDNFTTQKGYAYNRHGHNRLCGLDDLVVLPDEAIPVKVIDIYVAQTEYGEIIAADENFDRFCRSLGEAINARPLDVRKTVKNFFGTSKHVRQPISDTVLLLKCSDEDKPQLFHADVSPETTRFLRAYDRTTDRGREAIKRFISDCPNYEQRQYLRWLYTMKATHAETARALDICQALLKFSIRGSALRWASAKLQAEREWIKYI